MPRELPGIVDRAALRERLGAMPIPQDPQPGTDEHQVISWLTSLHLLYGVPFAYLVPDIGMLPVESIRFFQVDNAWVEALIDGAFSVGAPRATSDSGTVLRATAAPAARARLRRVRTALAGDTGTGTEAGAEADGAPGAITGFLLRSAVVSGWPGLEVRGYADTAAQHPLPLLRLERISPSLLFCLLGGVLQRVDLQEPPESLHFGVDPAAPSSPTPWQKQLRYASGHSTTQVGSRIPGGVQQVTLRPGTTSVLQIDALAQAMTPRVWASAPPSPTSFTAAQFGLEMVEGAQWVSFQVRS
jgi:hypothetical protein